MNTLLAALEAHNEEKEIEYGFFLHVKPEVLADVIEQLSNNDYYTFSESKLPTENGMYGRLRHYLPTDEQPEDVFEYTIKQKVVEDGGPTENDEDNTELSKVGYLGLMQLTTSTCIRTRYRVPFYRDGEPMIRKNGEALCWEVDVYVDGRQQGGVACEWVKVDLEVDKRVDIDVTPYIPFEYEEIIASSTKVPEERALIDNLYSNVYPVPAQA